jgi:hypothetical protein
MQMDLFQAEARKEIGLFLTSRHNQDWMDNAVTMARQMIPAGEIMGEGIRQILLPVVGEPRNPGATWGALINRLKYLHIIKGTGRYTKARGVQNHAHKYEIYIR